MPDAARKWLEKYRDDQIAQYDKDRETWFMVRRLLEQNERWDE